jgi:hypothetical protein
MPNRLEVIALPIWLCEEIERIIREAYGKVPYAVGLNNHMGSAMTSNLFGTRNTLRLITFTPVPCAARMAWVLPMVTLSRK